MANPGRGQLEKLTGRDALEALLRASGINYETLTGPAGPTRDKEARLACRVLLELAEGIWPALPNADGIASWREYVRETFNLAEGL